MHFKLLRLLLFTITVLPKGHTQALPNDWIGAWQGPLEIYDANGIQRIIDMSLEIQPIIADSSHNYQWDITYKMDSIEDVRNYSLKAMDSIGYHYLIDEHNGILLDAYLMQDQLTSVFEVMNSMLTVTYDLVDSSEIEFRIIVNSTSPIRSTSSSIQGQDDEIKVSSYKVSSLQVGRLKKFTNK